LDKTCEMRKNNLKTAIKMSTGNTNYLEGSENENNEELSLEAIENEIEELDPEALEHISEEAKNKILRAARAVSIRLASHHSGPLPRPEDLERYNLIIPNGAERIMAMTEKQSDHRMELEKGYMIANNSDSKRGQIFGFIISILFGSASVYLGIIGQPWLAGVLGGGTITGLVSVFVIGQRMQSKQD